jgi:hypothetical protein
VARPRSRVYGLSKKFAIMDGGGGGMEGTIHTDSCGSPSRLQLSLQAGLPLSQQVQGLQRGRGTDIQCEQLRQHLRGTTRGGEPRGAGLRSLNAEQRKLSREFVDGRERVRVCMRVCMCGRDCVSTCVYVAVLRV